MKIFRLFGLFVLMLTGCSIISTYPNKMAPVKTQLRQNNQKAALSAFSKSLYSEQLNDLEYARLLQLNDQSTASIQVYQKVIHLINQNLLKARIPVGSISEQTAAIALNDTVLPYAVPAYEQTFLYAFQAMNYLKLGDLSNAMVSIRQLSNTKAWFQNEAEDTRQASEQIRDNHIGVSVSDLNHYQKNPTIRQMKQESHSIAYSYDNPYADYLSAILYEAYNHDYNDAFVSIKKAYALLPNNKYVESTYDQIKRGFGGEIPYSTKSGRLVLILDEGLVQPKLQFNLPLFLGNLGEQVISLPYYEGGVRWNPTQLTLDDHQMYQTQLLVDTNLLAIKSLSEQYSSIIIRAVLRFILKSTASAQLTQKDNNSAGWLISLLYTLGTSGTDLRSWLLLPSNIQLFEKILPVGTHTLQIKGHKMTFKIVDQKTTLIQATQIKSFSRLFNRII